MVRVQVKHGGDGGGHDGGGHSGGGGGGEDDEKEFIYECQSNCTIDEIAKDIIEISNLQSKIQCLAFHLQPRLSLLSPKGLSLIRALSEAMSYSSKDQVLHNRPLSFYVLRNHMQAIEREFTLNHDVMGFTDSNLQQFLTDLNELKEDKAQLLWAGKELVRSKKLCDYIGNNEKTKIIIKLLSPISRPACSAV